MFSKPLLINLKHTIRLRNVVKRLWVLMSKEKQLAEVSLEAEGFFYPF